MVFITVIVSQRCLALIWCEGRSVLPMDASTRGHLRVGLLTVVLRILHWSSHVFGIGEQESRKCLAHCGIPMS